MRDSNFKHELNWKSDYSEMKEKLTENTEKKNTERKINIATD